MIPACLRVAALYLACLCVAGLSGCGRSPDEHPAPARKRPYTPVEPDPEQKAMAAELAPFRERFQQAHASRDDYALVAVLERNRRFEEFPEWGELTRVLIAHREQLDLDDYSFARPGQEASEDGQLETVLGEYFWIDEEGQILFDDVDQPPGTVMVVEWFVESGVPEATLHFGGSPCLTVRLNE